RQGTAVLHGTYGIVLLAESPRASRRQDREVVRGSCRSPERDLIIVGRLEIRTYDVSTTNHAWYAPRYRGRRSPSAGVCRSAVRPEKSRKRSSATAVPDSSQAEPGNFDLTRT